MSMKEELGKMENVNTFYNLGKILRVNQVNINDLDDEVREILLKGTSKEIEALSFCIDLKEHIPEFIFDCLIKLKMISKGDNDGE